MVHLNPLSIFHVVECNVFKDGCKTPMLFFFTALAVQCLVLFECILRRVIGLFFPSSRSALGRYTDKNVVAVGVSGLGQVFTVPMQMLASLASVSISALVVTVVLVLFGVALAENFRQGMSLIVGAYNQGVAPVLNVLFEMSLMLNSVLRFLLPVYNAIIYIPAQFTSQVLMPLVWQFADIIPSMISNASLAFTALVMSLVDYVKNMAKCAGEGIEVCNNSSKCGAAFVEYDLNCFANPAFLSVDLMTSGVYLRRVMFDLQHVLANTCASTALLVNVAIFPFLDFNLYKAIHCLVNVPFHGTVSLILGTLRRCEYLQATRATEVETAVGCTPDFLPFFSILVEALRALGRLVDNWLNSVVGLVLEALSQTQPTCSGWTVGATVEEAVQVFGVSTARVRVVGLTEKSVAVTDGVSAMYRSGSHQAWASYAWPFPVRVANGVAAVQATLSIDGDDGDGRTGLLGCECLDTPDGIALACASVALLSTASDDDALYNASTIHNVKFDAVSTVGMTCARTMVRVLPLRFSRRRVATSAGGGRDMHQRDPYATFGAKQQTSPFIADAAIYVQPLCGPAGPTCLPNTDSCYPW